VLLCFGIKPIQIKIAIHNRFPSSHPTCHPNLFETFDYLSVDYKSSISQRCGTFYLEETSLFYLQANVYDFVFYVSSSLHQFPYKQDSDHLVEKIL
jgi:hypothetical protein